MARPAHRSMQRWAQPSEAVATEALVTVAEPILTWAAQLDAVAHSVRRASPAGTGALDPCNKPPGGASMWMGNAAQNPQLRHRQSGGTAAGCAGRRAPPGCRRADAAVRCARRACFLSRLSMTLSRDIATAMTHAHHHHAFPADGVSLLLLQLVGSYQAEIVR